MTAEPAEKKVGSPIRHQNRCDQTPYIQEHADPAGHYPHPHGYFGSADVDVRVLVRVGRSCAGANDVPRSIG